MLLLLNSILIGLLRMLDGADKAPKSVLISCVGVILGYSIAINIVQFVLIVAATFLVLAPGWGSYLTASGEGVYVNEKESKLVDFILKFIPFYKPVIGMSLRWFLYSIPLAVVTFNPLLVGLLLIGPIYYAHRYHYRWWITEFSAGALFGSLALFGGNLLCIL